MTRPPGVPKAPSAQPRSSPQTIERQADQHATRNRTRRHTRLDPARGPARRAGSRRWIRQRRQGQASRRAIRRRLRSRRYRPTLKRVTRHHQHSRRFRRSARLRPRCFGPGRQASRGRASSRVRVEPELGTKRITHVRCGDLQAIVDDLASKLSGSRVRRSSMRSARCTAGLRTATWRITIPPRS